MNAADAPPSESEVCHGQKSPGQRCQYVTTASRAREQRRAVPFHGSSRGDGPRWIRLGARVGTEAVHVGLNIPDIWSSTKASKILKTGGITMPSVPFIRKTIMAQIDVSHVLIQGQSCAIFDADATSQTSDARARLLAQLSTRARAAGLRVDKSALAFAEFGRPTFYGAPDLVKYLSTAGYPGRTNTINF
jgi:hypothetical protein